MLPADNQQPLNETNQSLLHSDKHAEKPTMLQDLLQCMFGPDQDEEELKHLSSAEQVRRRRQALAVGRATDGVSFATIGAVLGWLTSTPNCCAIGVIGLVLLFPVAIWMERQNKFDP